ncbi:MAG: YbgC/FadM family acyl-CoA thioesterase [Candidatus Omnitrophica bacterium]|nr:YbgC/FadM family acyl-CoA thioesterase [Candidatus Omnitrophota bacterium]
MSTFTHKRRVYYHDTDCGGVVYYANYLKFFEEARTEHLRSKGIDLNKLADNSGILFAVVSAEVDYKSPARYGEEIDVLSKIIKINPASILFYNEALRDGKALVKCKTKLVSIDLKFKPVAIPQETSNLLGKL